MDHLIQHTNIRASYDACRVSRPSCDCAKSWALREFVGLWSGWLVVGFMLGGVLGRRSFGGL